jgi:hypothetical protein
MALRPGRSRSPRGAAFICEPADPLLLPLRSSYRLHRSRSCCSSRKFATTPWRGRERDSNQYGQHRHYHAARHGWSLPVQDSPKLNCGSAWIGLGAPAAAELRSGRGTGRRSATSGVTASTATQRLMFSPSVGDGMVAGSARGCRLFIIQPETRACNRSVRPGLPGPYPVGSRAADAELEHHRPSQFQHDPRVRFDRRALRQGRLGARQSRVCRGQVSAVLAPEGGDRRACAGGVLFGAGHLTNKREDCQACARGSEPLSYAYHSLYHGT